ncbi:MAG: PIG-L deacetylase family protein [Syntrophomonas sp.]
MNIKDARNVMVLAPHPDDEVLGCGGSLAWHAQLGASISVVYMTSGEAAGVCYDEEKTIGQIREQEASKGASYLGITDLHFLRHKDGELEYSSPSVRQLVNLIGQLQPEIVYAPHAGESHPDHRICHALARAAVVQAGKSRKPAGSVPPWEVRLLLGYEIWSPLSAYNNVMDITEFIDLKLQALSCHRSQQLDYDQAIAGLNRYRGVTSGKGAFCECFYQYL